MRKLKISLLRNGFLENIKEQNRDSIIDDELIETILNLYRSKGIFGRSDSHDSSRALEQIVKYLPTKFQNRLIQELPSINFEGFIDILSGSMFSEFSDSLRNINK